MITAERLVQTLGKTAEHPEVLQLFKELGIANAPEITDGVSADLEVSTHGIALFFRSAYHLRKIERLRDLPAETPVFSDVKFTFKGYGGGPGFAGVLPRGLSFSDTRLAVREKLGAPAWTSPVVKSDRWDFGDGYMTVAFAKDESKINRVTYGLMWIL